MPIQGGAQGVNVLATGSSVRIRHFCAWAQHALSAYQILPVDLPGLA